MSSEYLEKIKEDLIKRLKNSGYIRSKEVERAFRRVPREEFVRKSDITYAYRDTPLSIAHGQTISAPHMCAIMCEYLELKEGHKVLEIGAGSGYHAALCAELVAPKETDNPGHVYTIEIVKPLIEFAKSNIERAGYSDRITLIHGDGGAGLSEYAPFDRIFVAAAAPDVPPPLIEQLAPEGIMIIPVGSNRFYQQLEIIRKDEDGNMRKKKWGSVAFVPLTGSFGH